MPTTTARVENAPGTHRVTLRTGDNARALAVPPKSPGAGSSANGGELLCLALATCYCNDLYREAGKLSLEILAVEVDASADFEAEGEAARRIGYRVSVRAKATQGAIEELIAHTDRVAEVHNTLRLGIPVQLEGFEAIPEP